MKQKILLAIVLSVVLMGLASAVSCTSNSISKEYQTGSSTNQVQVSCTNSGNSTVQVSKTGNYFTINQDSINSSSSSIITVSFDPNAPSGFYNNFITFSDSSTPISVTLNVTAIQQTVTNPSSPIQVFPTSKVLTVQQGQEKTQNILISVPSNYPSSINIQSVDFNPGTEVIKFGDLNLGLVNPGQSVSIPILFSGKDAQIGTYQTNLNIFATNSTGQILLPTINLQLQVTQGVSPITNNTFSTPPSCSLSASTMNLNNTYSLTCSNIVNNLQVIPQVSDFFEGISVNYASNIYTYTFKPIKYPSNGLTDFSAIFSFQGSPIYQKFMQQVRISASSGTLAGTNLKLIFTPGLDKAKNKEQVVIQLVDNSSGSLVQNPQIFIDAVPLTNSSFGSFYFNFEAFKNYSVRGIAPGYNDLTNEIYLQTQPMTININPSSGDGNTIFNISTSVANASLFYNGILVSNPYTGNLPEGIVQLRATKEGYFETNVNITVSPGLRATPSGVLEKGISQILTLSRNVTWNLIYQDDVDALPTSLSSGSGGVVEFIPEKAGIYSLKFDEKVFWTGEIKGWDGTLFGISLWWWIGGPIILLGAIILIRRMRKGGDSSSLPFSRPLNTS